MRTLILLLVLAGAVCAQTPKAPAPTPEGFFFKCAHSRLEKKMVCAGCMQQGHLHTVTVPCIRIDPLRSMNVVAIQFGLCCRCVKKILVDDRLVLQGNVTIKEAMAKKMAAAAAPRKPRKPRKKRRKPRK